MLKIYNASAGSGKTSKLVNEYLKLVILNPSSYRNIIAITFTNNAAAEMKSRIIAALQEIIEDRYDKIDEELKTLSEKIDIKPQAQKALDNILHDYSNFSVSTIDSFFHRIIKSFAKELNLPIGFDVELDTDTVLDEAVDKLFKNLKFNPELLEAVERYVFDLIAEDKGWNIDRKLFGIGKELFTENYLSLSEDRSTKDLNDFINLLEKIINDFDEQMKRHSYEAGELLNKSGLSYTELFGGAGGVGNYLVNNIRKGKYAYGKNVEKVINENNWYSKTSLRKSEIDKCVSDGLGEILNNVVNLCKNGIEMYRTCKIIKSNIHLTGFLNNLAMMIGEYRKENKVFLISDTNYFLKKVIGNEEIPFIYEKTGIRYQHFLIDEFQDTSNMQWANLLPLISNILAEGNTALVVGDVKQSIYRWRGGEMNLLLGEISDALKQFKIDNRSLKTNYRSREIIIDFNNHFFQKLLEYSKNKIDYFDTVIENVFKDVTQDKHDKKGGYVQVKFIEQEKNKAENTQIAKEECCKIIGELKEKGYSLKDIMILIRKNEESFDIAEYLYSKGINVISPQSLQIKNSFAVQFMISIYRYICNRSNLIAKSQMNYFYSREILKDENDLSEGFTGDKDILTEHDYLNLRKLSLYEIAEETMRIFKLNERNDLYLQRFLDMILEYTKEHGNDVNEFLSWWDLHKNEVSVMLSTDEDAVTLMTIHKAKGLQKPVVLIPFANWLLQSPGENRIWVSAAGEQFKDYSPFLVNMVRDLELTGFSKDYKSEKIANYIDNLNLLYVTFTRAEDKLFIISPKTGSTNKNIHDILKEIFDNFDYDDMITDENKTEFTFGKFESRIFEDKMKESRKNLTYTAYKFEPGILEAVAAGKSWHERFITRSKGHSFAGIPDEKLIEKMDTGIILHEALARLDNVKDTGIVLCEMESEGIMERSQSDLIKSGIESIMALPEVKSWFEGGIDVLTEREIITAGGKILRPDRVMIKNDSYIVADYKTGQKKEEYASQIREYKKAIKEMSNKDVRCYLVYVDLREIEEVD
jgi:ATP-dependent helicase/nuclease subunit A